MHPKRASSSLRQDLEIPPSLRRLYDAESVLLTRNGQFHSIVTSDLQEHTRIRPAFVSLPRGMQESRPESEARGDVLRIANGVTQRLQVLLVLGIHLYVSKHREIIACMNAAEVRLQISD